MTKEPKKLRPITYPRLQNILMDCENRLKIDPPRLDDETDAEYGWRVGVWRRDVQTFIDAVRIAMKERESEADV